MIENESPTFQNLLDTMKAFGIYEFLALSDYMKKLGSFHISNLTVYLKSIEQKRRNCSQGVDGKK